MKIAKILALFLVLALIVGTMASCGAEELTAKQLVENSYAEMAKSPYKVNIDLSFTTDNESYKEIISAMSIKDIEMEVDGRNMHFNFDMDMGVIKAQMEYTAINGTVYTKMVTTGLGANQTVKNKATLTDEELDEFLAETNLYTDTNIEDFMTTVVEKDGDTYKITCEGITDKLNEELSDLIGSSASGLDGASTISDATYVVNMKNNKIESAKLSCTYKAPINGEEVAFTLNLDIAYDYSAKVSITAPSDAATYTEVDSDEILGA